MSRYVMNIPETNEEDTVVDIPCALNGLSGSSLLQHSLSGKS